MAVIEEAYHHYSWETLGNSTESINRHQATVAVEVAYLCLGLEAPEITFYSSPKKALAELAMLKRANETKLIYRLKKLVQDALHPLSLLTGWQRGSSELIRWESQLEAQLIVEISDYYRTYLSPRYIVMDLPLAELWVSAFSIPIAPEAQKLFECLKQIVAKCGWIFPLDDICIVCDRPSALRLDSEYRLHAEGEAALEFADGYKIYSYHGVTLPEKYGQIHPDRWESTWILEEKNAELRRVLIQGIGYDKICCELQAAELDSWQEYTLLQIDNADVEPIYLLKMTCPSTGFIHALRVPPNMTSAREAIRWVNWDIDADEFSVQT
ncbi:DUF6745 domain-containing protein [Microcoleus sp. bin38.metabat.b11b12b14.051]|uniref:DUF6745 domain-containing protein n=1 Tax=Microcoleus sp. bin38.metabat.b11b12b14.051 TaxID=2742709 RepID=UPI0025ECF9E8|nr:hypothetical protein [Microcoleus sp. bin38.metabat.b11b12b14.051]